MLMIGDNYSSRKCERCGEVKREPDDWWEFVSWNCQPCEMLVIADWQKKTEARYVNPPEGESY